VPDNPLSARTKGAVVASVTRSIEIAGSADAVWKVLEDVRLLPQMSHSTTHVEAPERLSAVGDTFEQTVKLAGKSFTSKWTVRDIDPGTRLVISGSVLPGTKYTMTEEIESLDSSRTRLSLIMDYSLPFGPVGRLAAKLGAERRANSEATTVLEGVRRLVEQRSETRAS